MQMALDLAKKGEGFTSPNPMVGAVIVKDDKVIGRGYHKAAGQAHAEVDAINNAGSLARDGTLYVTLEPCNHTGRTPPCTQKIIGAGIRHVVAAMEDQNPDVKGGGLEYLKNRGINTTVGICEDQAKKLNEFFIKYTRTKRPFTFIKCAATLDGRIATKSGDSRWVTGEAARGFVHRLRHAVDAILKNQAGRIGVLTNQELLLIRLELEIVDQLRRIYTLTKRVAREFGPGELAVRSE